MQSTSRPLAESGSHEFRGIESPGAPHGRAHAGAPIIIPIERGRSVEVLPAPEGAHLRVRDEAGAALDIEIRFDAGGPIVGVRAQRLEIEGGGHIAARCDTFSVHARQKIELMSEGELVQKAAGKTTLEAHDLAVTAKPGAIRLQANDDVQLLGENVLLNCERPKPLPEWARARVRPEPVSMAPEDESGSSELVALLTD
jgi:hypothetical protein